MQQLQQLAQTTQTQLERLNELAVLFEARGDNVSAEIAAVRFALETNAVHIDKWIEDERTFWILITGHLKELRFMGFSFV